jgi:hypothetical protein
LGVRLLGDLRIIFDEAISLHTETIVDRLLFGDGLDADAPWSSLHGKTLDKRGLASMLKRYGVSPQKVTIEGRSLQGYRREHLWDAWHRYLPPASAGAELPELSTVASGNAIPPVPQVPPLRIPKRACLKCDGNGCDWCGEWKSVGETEDAHA